MKTKRTDAQLRVDIFLLALMAWAVMGMSIACFYDIGTPTASSSTNVTVENDTSAPAPLPTTPGAGGGTPGTTVDPAAGPNLVITDGPEAGDNVVTSQRINIGTPSTNKVIACSIPVGSGSCPESAEVPTEDLQVSDRDIRTITNIVNGQSIACVGDPSPCQPVASVKEISGRFVTWSGLFPGTAEATIRANGQAKGLILIVQ